MIKTITNQIANSRIEKLAMLEQSIGNTPLLPITKLINIKGVRIYAKVEWLQLSGSVKARAAFNIIKDAIHTGAINDETILLDATSGNTGIAYATIGAQIGLPVTLCLPENASKERIHILKSLGAKIIFTSRFGGTDDAQQVAAELAANNPNTYFYADQYRNDQNWKAHFNTTAEEIYKQAPGITHFVAGLGTTGTFIGTSRKLKLLNSKIEVTALQPDFAMHGLEGWKHLETALIPPIYDDQVADHHLTVATTDAYEIIKAAFVKEGLSLSPSSAANLAGAIAIAKQIMKGVIVTILPDNGEKYTDIIKKILVNDASYN